MSLAFRHYDSMTVQRHGLRPSVVALEGPHEGRCQLSLSPPIVGLTRNSLSEAIRTALDTDIGVIRFNFSEYTEKAVSFDTAF